MAWAMASSTQAYLPLAEGPTGKAGTFGEFSFHFLELNSSWTIGRDIWQARIGYTLLPRETIDDATKISHLILSTHYGIPLDADWMLRMGLGILRTESRGQGGAVVLNNGSGTSTFYRPSDSQTINQIMVEAGIAYDFNPEWTMSFDFLVNSILNDKRTYNFFISLSYQWSQGIGSTATVEGP